MPVSNTIPPAGRKPAGGFSFTAAAVRASDRARAAAAAHFAAADALGPWVRERLTAGCDRGFASLVCAVAAQRLAEATQDAMLAAVGEFGRALSAEFAAVGVACRCEAPADDVLSTRWRGRVNMEAAWAVSNDAFGAIARGEPAEAATATLARAYRGHARTFVESALGDAWRASARAWGRAAGRAAERTTTTGGRADADR